jgi:aryl-alcohol dehydrogenase-like predicted oxidoreductase
MRPDTQFDGDDLRGVDPKFQPPRFAQYLAAVARLDELARKRFDRRVIHLAVRWILDQGVSVALWGGRHPAQLEPVAGLAGGSMDAATRAAIDIILNETIHDPVGPEFMAPPQRPLLDMKLENLP